jgi:hypothetical protein
MPKKSASGSKKKRTPSLRNKLLKDLRTERKALKSKLRTVERDIRSLRGSRKRTQ